MTLETALDDKGITGTIRQLVLDLAQRAPCQPLSESRDGHSVPLVREADGQVALYPLKRRVAIAMTPEDAVTWSIRLGGARVEAKSPRTHYVHLTATQLSDGGLRHEALAAGVHALDTVGRRKGRERDAAGAGAKDFGTCETHGYTLNGWGECPTCNEP